MYRRTSKSTHYIPRTGSYSTVPHRNGRVEILPPEAQPAIFSIADQIADATKRLEYLRQRKETLVDRTLALGRIDQLREKFGSDGSADRERVAISKEIKTIETEAGQTRRRLGELKAILAGGANITFDSVFSRLAEVELPPDVYEMIAEQARLIVRKARP